MTIEERKVQVYDLSIKLATLSQEATKIKEQIEGLNMEIKKEEEAPKEEPETPATPEVEQVVETPEEPKEEAKTEEAPKE